jgi:sugar O-acyltransferase (sialic acid O-acetyltransferase NeuD family)
MPDPIRNLLVCGTRTLAEEVADLAAEVPGIRVAGFVENMDRERCTSLLHGLPVIWHEELPRYAADHCAVVALATTQRNHFTEQVAAAQVPFATIIHPAAQVSTSTTLGEGCVVSAGVIIAAHTELGCHVFVNRGALIGHHTVIGHHVSIMPGANIGGMVHIGEHTYLGMGAIVLDHIAIGDHCLIAAGALVNRNAPPHTQWMGLPAAVVRQNLEGK